MTSFQLTIHGLRTEDLNRASTNTYSFSLKCTSERGPRIKDDKTTKEKKIARHGSYKAWALAPHQQRIGIAISSCINSFTNQGHTNLIIVNLHETSQHPHGMARIVLHYMPERTSYHIISALYESEWSDLVNPHARTRPQKKQSTALSSVVPSTSSLCLSLYKKLRPTTYLRW